MNRRDFARWFTGIAATVSGGDVAGKADGLASYMFPEELLPGQVNAHHDATMIFQRVFDMDVTIHEIRVPTPGAGVVFTFGLHDEIYLQRGWRFRVERLGATVLLRAGDTLIANHSHPDIANLSEENRCMVVGHIPGTGKRWYLDQYTMDGVRKELNGNTDGSLRI